LKYEKPKVRNLNGISPADGACLSGQRVGICGPFGGLAGACTGGDTAGSCSGSGLTVTAVNCLSTGFTAADCTSGRYAILIE